MAELSVKAIEEETNTTAQDASPSTATSLEGEIGGVGVDIDAVRQEILAESNPAVSIDDALASELSPQMFAVLEELASSDEQTPAEYIKSVVEHHILDSDEARSRMSNGLEQHTGWRGKLKEHAEAQEEFDARASLEDELPELGIGENTFLRLRVEALESGKNIRLYLRDLVQALIDASDISPPETGVLDEFLDLFDSDRVDKLLGDLIGIESSADRQKFKAMALDNERGVDEYLREMIVDALRLPCS